MGGDLGQLNGLPVSIIIRTTLQELESRAGVGVTGGGTIVPIADVLRLAAHANLFLAVFDKATGSALELFRTKRVASPAQRIMLIGRDGGCTKPGCTVGPYGCQVHHAAAEWADDGQTNVDDMGLACGPDNRIVDNNGGWTTQMNDHHDVEWLPPPHLDTNQTRINHYHRPETLLHPPDDEPADTPEPTPPQANPDPHRAPQPFDAWGDRTADGTVHAVDAVPGDGAAEPLSVEPLTVQPTQGNEDSDPEPLDPWADVGTRALIGDQSRPDPLFDPWASDDTAEPGGPEPNTG
jgi:hypothetical protein